MIIASNPCSFRRYCALIASPLSQCRFFMHEKLRNLILQGRCLDIGGTKHSSYHDLLHTETELITLNISAEHEGGADILADCNKPLPIEDNSFDSVLSANTFEHIKNDELAIREAMRILKPGGHFHILVPFCVREHGCPYDFHRHTASWWNEFFVELGLCTESFTIEPLVWDEFATGTSFFEMRCGFARPIIRLLFCLPGLLFKNFRIRKTGGGGVHFIDLNAVALYIHIIKT